MRRNTNHVVGMVLFLWLIFNLYYSHAWAKVSYSDEKTDKGKSLVKIENDFYRLEFEPEKGGRCTSFLVKKTSRELVYPGLAPGEGFPGADGGFFFDYFNEEPSPGEFINTPYEYEVTCKETEKVVLKLWRLATGKVKEEMFPSVVGVLLEKTVVLYSDSRVIDVYVFLTNTTEEVKIVSYRTQHAFQLSGDKEGDIYYRPTTRNIQIMKMAPSLTGVVPEEWVRDPVEGWSAGRDEDTNEGIVFIMDYNYLSILFNGKACTAEWFMDSVILFPKTSWKTKYSVIPIDGFSGFAYASDRIISNIEVYPEKDRMRIKHTLAGTRSPLRDVTVNTSIYGVRNKKTEEIPHLIFDNVGLEPTILTVDTKEVQKEPIVIRVVVKTKEWEERYETYFVGEFESHVLPGYPVPPEYLRPKPHKHKSEMDIKSKLPTSFIDNKRLDVLYFFGLYSQYYLLKQVIRSIEPSNLKVSDGRVGIHYEGADYIPKSYDELLQYDVVILSDVDMKSLRNFGMSLLPMYVRQGGGLLVLGGPFAYGHGDYRGTEIESILPVDNMGDFDLKWEKNGLTLVTAMRHEILKNVDFTTFPKVYWFHDLKPRPNTDVLVRAGSHPILVLGRCEKGRVATFLGAPLGMPQGKDIPFWEWSGWQELMKNTMSWLAER